jgi:hypothetical protein
MQSVPRPKSVRFSLYSAAIVGEKFRWVLSRSLLFFPFHKAPRVPGLPAGLELKAPFLLSVFERSKLDVSKQIKTGRLKVWGGKRLN